ncbi:sensor histidine kinase [Gracilibacillus sp. YIM 98692]|uniref:cache domain-containing sensor histidine kinase n=1 Tax=Gracilibacillus sp. YIM 98692 TaxID=2663532 RepID=UPI0013D241CE|nr:sensor histidine kinase [Gracilibacillus sp. YIM 98692]
MKKYRDWSIQLKLLTITALLLLGSVSVVSILSYFQYTKDFEEQSADKVQQIIEQFSFNVDSYLNELFRLSHAPYFNENMMKALEQDSELSALQQLQKRRTIEDYLAEMMITPRKDILQVFILSGTEIYSSQRYRSSIDSTVNPNQYRWYQEALSTQKPIFVSTHEEQLVNNPKTKVFSIVKQLRSINNTMETLGVIKVDANYRGIQQMVDKIDMGTEGGIFIIDQNQNIVFSNMKQPEVPFAEAIQHTDEEYITYNMEEESFLINSTTLSRSDWTIVAVNSVQELNKNAAQTRNVAFLLALVSALLALIILFFFVRTFLKPLFEIVRLMRKINQGNLSVQFPTNRNDEIGYLGSSFNEMVSEIKNMLEENTKLVKEVYEAKYLQKEAQMNVLSNQIKPHFILNTLNMISILIQSGEQEKGIEHINQLSKILQNITLWETEIPLERELDLLYAYLNIQSSRFEGKLDYEIDIDPKWMNYKIPALLFQPIVENAVIHGSENQREKTTIYMYSEENEKEIQFFIKDDGKGMKNEELNAFRKQLPESTNRDETAHWEGKGLGIGMLNVHRRIKMKYGNAYGLSMDSEPGKGMSVCIHLPKRF